HGPEELGYPPITEAMVNIRATLASAQVGKVISAATSGFVTGLAKTVLYKERAWDTVLAAAATDCPEVELQRLRAWLPHGRMDQKRVDALAMLEAIRTDLGAPRPGLAVSYAFADTTAWQSVVQLYGG